MLFLLTAGDLLAQPNLIRGRVLDASTNEIIPFAWLINSELHYYVQSDINGDFSLYYSTNKDFTLTISFVGYLNDSIKIEAGKSTAFLTVKLKINPYELPVAKVDQLSLKSIINQAIKNIPSNYFDSTFYFDATFLQYHFEKNNNEKERKAVRLIYADIDVKQNAELIKTNLSGNEKVIVNGLLRSNVYEENKEEHGDHLMDVLEENPVYHTKGTALNNKSINFYHFSLDSSTNENDQNYKINYELINKQSQKLQKGYLVIDKTTFAIKTFYKEELPNGSVLNRINYITSVPYRWDFIFSCELVNYQNQNGKYVLKNSYSQYQHLLIDNKIHSPSFTVYEYFELEANSKASNSKPNNTINFSKKSARDYSSFSNLYSLKLPYDDAFYIQFLKCNFFLLSDMEKQNLLADLTTIDDLKNQFVKNCE